MTAVATSIALVMAGVLLWAGLDKVRDPDPIVSTIRHLGILNRRAVWAAALLAITEICVALGLLFNPHSAWTLAGVVTVAGTFAGAGMFALSRDEPIRCSCFGSGGNGQLGSRQIVALVPWLASAAIVRWGIQGSLPLPAGAYRFMAVSLTIACMRVVPVWKARLEARDDRRSAEEMFAWRRSR
jgi:hypothetical protein